MARQFEARRYYFLLDAFDRLGAHLFGEEWTGLEAWAGSVESPEKVRHRRQVIRDRIADLDVRIDKVSRKRQTAIDPADEINLLEKQNRLTLEREAAQIEARTMPQLGDALLADHATFERRQRTEAILFDGAQNDRFGLRYGPNELLDWPRWSRQPGFNVYISLSMATLPNSGFGRRGPVLVVRSSFDTWLDTVTPLNLASDSPEAQKAAFIDCLLDAFQDSEHPRKSDMQTVAREQYGIGTNEFRRIWNAHAPADAKRGGRRPQKIIGMP